MSGVSRLKKDILRYPSLMAIIKIKYSLPLWRCNEPYIHICPVGFFLQEAKMWVKRCQDLCNHYLFYNMNCNFLKSAFATHLKIQLILNYAFLQVNQKLKKIVIRTELQVHRTLWMSICRQICLKGNRKWTLKHTFLLQQF